MNAAALPARRALVFASFNPCPPRSGLHRRVLSMVSGLRELGFGVTLASATWTDPEGWGGGAHRGAGWVDAVRLYESGRWDNRFWRVRRPWGRLTGPLLPVDSAPAVPPRMRRWFRRLCDELVPDVVVMVHAWWDALVDHRALRGVSRVMETIDLVTLNAQMWELVVPRLPPPPADPAHTPPELLDERFFERAGMAAHRRELRLYDRYTHTVAISPDEAAAIAAATRRTRVVHLPMTVPPVFPGNRYDGPAFFPTGPNPFNVQGYLYFAGRVLPRLRRAAPDFRLRVTGYCAGRVAPRPGVELSGWVDDLAAVYAAAPFMVAPVFGGTGQQVKIVEAMAHGVPVVALRAAARGAPIEHGVNGLLADDAEEMAEQAAELWGDRARCRALGQAAREAAAAEHASARFSERLADLVRSA